MSSVGTVAARSRWIISPLWDSLFFVGTPILCAACILPLTNLWSSFTIWLVVMTFSSFGHHLPGFLRAYGDPELFARYRVRFLLAPPFVFGAFLYLAHRDLHGAELVLVFWSIWHLMMQHYGFMRIYDAKAGSTGRWVARLDFWLCLSWFAAIAIWSPHYRHNVLRGLYNSGVPFLSPDLMNVLYGVITAVTLSLTAVYVLYAVASIVSGRAISVIKLVLHALSMSFLYYLWVVRGDFFLGVAAWEVFHDIQYFAIVWVYNKTLVQKGHRATWLLRFVFRPRFSLILLYLLLIFGYGGINYASGFVTRETLVAVVVAFLGTSTALHFYYDGFIWKVRQQKTREALAIEPAVEKVGTILPTGWSTRIGSALSSGLSTLQNSFAHAVLFLLVIGALATAETYRPDMQKVEVYESLAALVPDSPRSFTELGRVYREESRPAEAKKSFENALKLSPDDPAAHNGVGLLLLETGEHEAIEEAAEHFKQAMAADPFYLDSYLSLGLLRLKQARNDESIELFRRAIELDANSRPGMTTVIAYEGLASAYQAAGRREEVIEARQKAEGIRRRLNRSPSTKPDGFGSG